MDIFELDAYIPTLRKKNKAFESTVPFHNDQCFSALLESRNFEGGYGDILLEEYQENIKHAFNRGYQRGVTQTLERPEVKAFTPDAVSLLQNINPEMNIAKNWYHLDEFGTLIYKKIHCNEIASEFQSPLYMMSLFMFDLGFKIGVQNQAMENEVNNIAA